MQEARFNGPGFLFQVQGVAMHGCGDVGKIERIFPHTMANKLPRQARRKRKSLQRRVTEGSAEKASIKEPRNRSRQKGNNAKAAKKNEGAKAASELTDARVITGLTVAMTTRT
jgi:hypothetical protein